MRIDEKHIGKMVRIVDSGDAPVWMDRPIRNVVAIRCNVLNWVDFIYEDFANHNEFLEASSYLPLGTMGLLVERGKITTHVTVNWAKVLFPETKHQGFDRYGTLYDESVTNLAGGYWISGDYLEIVETP